MNAKSGGGKEIQIHCWMTVLASATAQIGG